MAKMDKSDQQQIDFDQVFKPPIQEVPEVTRKSFQECKKNPFLEVDVKTMNKSILTPPMHGQTAAQIDDFSDFDLII